MLCAGTGWVTVQRWRSGQEQRNWVTGRVPMESLRLHLEVTARNTNSQCSGEMLHMIPMEIWPSDDNVSMEPWGVGRMGRKRAQDRYSFMGVTLIGRSSVHYRHWNTDWLKRTIFHESVKTEFSMLGNSVSPDIKEQFSGFSFKYSSISSM